MMPRVSEKNGYVCIALESGDSSMGDDGQTVPGVILTVTAARTLAQSLNTVANKIDKRIEALSELDFEEAVKKIAYEMYHFRRLAQIYPASERLRGFWWQLVSQSLLLHLRIMFEIFYPGRSAARSITLTHFIDGCPNFNFPTILQQRPIDVVIPTRRPAGGPDRMTLDEIKESLDRWLVHFGKGRWTMFHTGYEYYGVCFADIDRRIIAFRTALPKALQGVFDARLSEFENRERDSFVPINLGSRLYW